MRAVISEVRGFELAALCAADREQALYEALGWEPWRGPLSLRSNAERMDTPGESVMIHRRPDTPPRDVAGRLSAEWREGEPW